MAYSIRRLFWPSQETVTDFAPTSVNSAGSFDLATDGVVICGRKTKTETLIWTSVDLWTANYIGAPFYYSFTQKGNDCGLIGQNAIAMVDSTAFWMSPKKQFFRFDGFVKVIPCEVTDYVFGNFNTTYGFKVFAFPNTEFSEVTWFYPSSSSTECDRYVTYNYLEDHWTFGTLSRSCAVVVQAGATTGVPVLIDSSGRIYDHETGNARSSSAYLESGPLELENGDHVAKVQRIVPDEESAAQVVAYLLTALFPNGTETTNGPYTLSSPTSVRLTARQFRVRLTESVASAWRVGVFRLGVIKGGRR